MRIGFLGRNHGDLVMPASHIKNSHLTGSPNYCNNQSVIILPPFIQKTDELIQRFRKSRNLNAVPADSLLAMAAGKLVPYDGISLRFEKQTKSAPVKLC